MRWLLALLALAGCQKIFGLDHVDPLKIDASTDTPKIFLDAPPAGIVCAGQAGSPLHICAPAAMLQGLTYSIAIDINTDDDAMCTRVDPAQGRQGALCEVITSQLDLTSTGSITAHGSRPLVLVAMGTMTIAGTVDVSTHGNVVGAAANDPTCVSVSGQGQAAGSYTSGGGAGGSFGSRGGAAGAPGNGGAQLAPPPIDPTMLAVVRGGCRGGAGGNPISPTIAIGGSSGGAVYLMAGSTLTITGKVLANGAGGQGGKAPLPSDYPGGAGGGSGGLIMLDAAAYSLSGVLMANGGGGGAGASDSAAAGGDGSDPDPATPLTAAAGGAPTGDVTGGSGGTGSTLSEAGQGGFGMETQPSMTGGAGGGGGGGKGVIRMFPTPVTGGTIVPAAT